jgi:hypothetical protein
MRPRPRSRGKAGVSYRPRRRPRPRDRKSGSEGPITRTRTTTIRKLQRTGIARRHSPHREVQAPSLLDGDGHPAQDCFLHELHLFRSEFAEATQEVLGRHSLHALDEKCAFGKPADGNEDFELRAALSRCVRNHANQRPIGVSVGHADDQCGANLLRNTEVHLPYFTPFRHPPPPPHPVRGRMPQPRRQSLRQ